LIQQTCTVNNGDCGSPAKTIAEPSVMTEQYYRYYKPGTAKCGPPFDVPPAVPTTPPTSAGTPPTLVQGTSNDFVNSAGFGGMNLGAGPAAPQNDDWLIASFAGNGFTAPAKWTPLINGGSQAVFYCHVGTASGDCPSQSSYAFGGGNHGGIGHIREYSGASGPPVPVNTPNPQYERRDPVVVDFRARAKRVDAGDGGGRGGRSDRLDRPEFHRRAERFAHHDADG
jgi:hypothetical protein